MIAPNINALGDLAKSSACKNALYPFVDARCMHQLRQKIWMIESLKLRYGLNPKVMR